jgi:hypothetical protein
MIYILISINLKALNMTLIKCRDTNLNAPSGCKNYNLACLFNVYTYAKRLQSWNDIITHQKLIIN